jgi:hypothetical protein
MFVMMRMRMIVRGVVVLVVAVVIAGRVGIVTIDQHAGFARADAAAIYRIEDEGRGEIEGRGRLLQERGRDAGVDQGAEQHVSAKAGEAFEIADTHDGSF